MLTYLPTAVKDLNWSRPKGRIDNAMIRRAIYLEVTRRMFEPARFLHKEPVGNQEGLFIKGYVNDVWAYLKEAYDMIHETNFIRDHRETIHHSLSSQD